MIAVWVNTYCDQSPVIRKQVDSHHVGRVNWLNREGLPQEYNRPYHHWKGLVVPM